MTAIGVVETVSIPLGVLAGDQMVKTAQVELVTAQTVCAGKYIVVVSGEVAAVRSAVAAGVESAASALVDSLVIANVDERVVAAMAGACPTEQVLAVGVMPLMENGFNLVTPQVLLELSMPTQPLLRLLQTEAPGTHQHSLMVANLAEAAADLERGREHCAAHADDTCFAQAGKDGFRILELLLGQGSQIRAGGVLVIVFDNDRHYHIAQRMGSGLDRYYLA